MNRRAAALYLGLTIIGIVFSHVSIEHEDNGYLVNIDGRRYDVAGSISDFKSRATSNCTQLHLPVPQSPEYIATMAAIRAFSPPDSASAKIASLIRHDDWLLAEVEFDTLLPAVVLLRQEKDSVKIQERAIWSGTTQPWKAAPLIRNYISHQAPEAPASLFSCFTPRSSIFK
jgi:hypothetical protein